MRVNGGCRYQHIDLKQLNIFIKYLYFQQVCACLTQQKLHQDNGSHGMVASCIQQERTQVKRIEIDIKREQLSEYIFR